MIRLGLCFLLALGLALPAQAQPYKPPFAFLVPVTLSNLHKNLTLLRVRCWVLPTTDWKTKGPDALGEGVSGPVDTVLDAGIRTFSGDVQVSVPMRDMKLDPASARAYRCQVELYDAAGRSWGDMAMIDKRYPLDKASMSIAETGGAFGQ
jgi:hypothetical protein